MNKALILATLLLPLFFMGCEQSDPPEREYFLVWSDEFDANVLDDSKWEVMLGDGSQYGLWGWGNNEEQYYQEENISVENGRLKIKAIAEEVGGYDYTSARIRSLNKGDFKYGRIEASIRMANTPGLWHAFWMLPTNPSESWPVSGEIDIMENVGNLQGQILNTVHFADQFGGRRQLGNSTLVVQDNNFHHYAVDWTENKIVWSIDSVETFTVLRTNDQINATWPFDAQFHILLNTAVGGNLGGNIDANAMQTAKFMEVDYVRVYQEQ